MPNTQIEGPACVIYNPAAGRGRARKQIDTARRQLAPDAELFPTEGPHHASEVAASAVSKGFKRIIAAGGDGTVHEVANGILNANDSSVAMSVWPLGSMNDYAFTLGLVDWWHQADKPPLEPIAVDVGRASAGNASKWFINSAGVGFNGMVTIESRKIRWLRGIPLYAYGLLKAMVKHYSSPILKVSIDERNEQVPVLMMGIYLGQREGGFPIGKDAKLDDGLFDTFRAGDVWRWELVRHLPGLITGNLPTNHPKLARDRGKRIQIVSKSPLCCHLDGEFLCQPVDQQNELQFEVIRSKLTVECFRARLYGGFAKP
ncbi:MAG: diacylglycerol kinase family protein [Gemmataceae bacterium]